MTSNNYFFTLLFFQLVFIIYGKENESDPLVEIEQGKVQGKISEDYIGKPYYSFQGIPYGKSPTGELRFKAPVPAESWKDTFDATKEGSECFQYEPMVQRILGNEDCLNLNVYTTELPNNGALKPKPVMVFIHGGGFNSGSGKSFFYGPDFLITEDVVIVTINYRLGAFGFLSFEDTSLGVPGNSGLKDMVLALKWVQKNINHFNGDPSKVTIFGESAGSAACHYLVLSESAKGLFHRAILQSGVALNPWATGTRNAIYIANVLESNATNEQEALDFLKGVPTEKFVSQSLVSNGTDLNTLIPFGPVIEHPNPEAFLTKHPIDLMNSGKYNNVSIMIGYTSREGMLFDLLAKLNNQKIDFRLKDFEKAIPAYYNITSETELSKTVAKKIEDFYYNKSKTPEEDQEQFYILYTDLLFVRGIFVTIRSLLKSAEQPIYLYRFNIETELNILKKFSNITLPGVCHGDDIGYLFKGYFTPKEIAPNSVEEIGLKRVLKLWTNFAKSGNPTPENTDNLIDVKWPSVKSDNIQCLDIDKSLKITKNPEEERMKFWDEISALDGINSSY